MRCYKCNSVLSDQDYCLKCGADVSVYKVVVKASNSYYNTGLLKAKVRDLSGAVTALKTSLSINKNNIKARNLLGLVYYEMGEVALALSEWVISLNLKPDKNVADVYIRKVKANPNKLEAVNQATKKYNLSLEKAQEGGDDVALIQLKRVIAVLPNHIKANLLLALLYMKRNDSGKAEKILRKVLKIDRNNTLALRYLDEIHHVGEGADKPEEDYYKGRKRIGGPLSGNDVIMPKNSYKEPASGVLTVIYILLGVLIGTALVWFLVVPSKLQSTQYENNNTIKEYSEKLSSYSVDITELEDKVKDLERQLADAESDLASYKGENGEMAMYSKLIEAAGYFMANDFENAALSLADIDVTQLPTDTAKALYTSLEESCSGGARSFYLSGVNAYNQQDYVNAIKYLEKAYQLDDTTVETPYYLVMSYMGINDTENAQKYIDIVHNRFGNTSYATQLDQYLNSINE